MKEREKTQNRKKIPNERVGESKKKKREERKILDQGSEENRGNVQKGRWTRRYLNSTELSPSEQEKANHNLKWSSPFDCQQNHVR